jgi:hypothetical protein
MYAGVSEDRIAYIFRVQMQGLSQVSNQKFSVSCWLLLLNPEGGYSGYLRNVRKFLAYYTISRPRI